MCVALLIIACFLKSSQSLGTRTENYEILLVLCWLLKVYYCNNANLSCILYVISLWMGVSSFWWHNRYHWHEPWIMCHTSLVWRHKVTMLRMSHFCSLVSKDALLGIECFEFWKFWYVFIVHKVLLCHKIKQNSIRHDRTP